MYSITTFNDFHFNIFGVVCVVYNTFVNKNLKNIWKWLEIIYYTQVHQISKYLYIKWKFICPKYYVLGNIKMLFFKLSISPQQILEL